TTRRSRKARNQLNYLIAARESSSSHLLFIEVAASLFSVFRTCLTGVFTQHGTCLCPSEMCPRPDCMNPRTPNPSTYAALAWRRLVRLPVGCDAENFRIAE